MYNKRYFSQAKLESEQKDIIIAQLKADIFEMRKNEEDYYVLQEELRKLEHKFKIASEEKMIQDEEFRQQHENNLRNMSSFKGECDDLQQDLRTKSRDMQEIVQDNLGMRQICDQRQAEISKLKHQIQFELGKSDQFREELELLKEQEDLLKGDRRNLLVQLDDSKIEGDEAEKRKRVLESQIQEQETQKVRLDKQLENIENENTGIDQEIQNKEEEIIILEKRNMDMRKEVKQREYEIETAQNERMKNQNEARHYQNLMQNETQRNEEMNQRIENFEELLRNKEKQINDLKQDIDEIHNDNNTLLEENKQLNDDSQGCERHRDLLQQANEELLQKLHKYCDQDDQIREILNRRQKLLAFSNIRKREPMLNGSLRASRMVSPNKYAQYYDRD